MTATQAGTTLVELLVVLVILGVIAGVVSLGLLAATKPDATTDRLGRVRARVAEQGVSEFAADDSGRTLLLLPDGEILGAGIDPLTGERHATR